MAEGLHVPPDGALWGYLNHSCEPNCRIICDTWTLCALRDIDAGAAQRRIQSSS